MKCLFFALFLTAHAFASDFEIAKTPRVIRVDGQRVELQDTIRDFFRSASYTEVVRERYDAPGLVTVQWCPHFVFGPVNLPGIGNVNKSVKGQLVDANGHVYAWVYFYFTVTPKGEFYRSAVITLVGARHQGKLIHEWTEAEIRRVFALELQVATDNIGQKAN